MNEYEQNLKDEQEYLEFVLSFLKFEINKGIELLLIKKSELVDLRKDMWENTVHFSEDFARLTEMNQYLSEINIQTANYEKTQKQIEKYKKMLAAPYFGRFDFVEDGIEGREKIYIGIHNVRDSKTHVIHVYDWRAPISSLFYRFEPGQAKYQAPFSEISGEMLLKRQYKIQSGKLKYFFDCSIRINDEILQEVLSRNSSVKMRNIVETIQKEQDVIVRDTENELLVVQGVAGSGKTSIALHRIAFLLYEGMGSKIGSNNIIIISPNSLFSNYISTVLPELGEDNVEQTTVDELFYKVFEGSIKSEKRNMQLESIIKCEDVEKSNFIRSCIEFKGSNTFITILDRLMNYFEHRLIEFEDIYFNGSVLESKQQLKNSFLKNDISMPMAKRLKRLESKMLDRVHPLQRKRLEKIEELIQKGEGHEFEVKPFSRLLSMKEGKNFIERLHKFTEIDCYKLYKLLFSDMKLIFKLAKELDLPETIENILLSTNACLNDGDLKYEDTMPLLYLKLKMEGNDLYSEIKQVVVDEAQDYYAIHYKVFGLLFRNAKFTVLGDVSQTIERQVEISYYEEIEKILNKRTSMKLFLNKSYRASYEINSFAQKLFDRKTEFISFERHETEPLIIHQKTQEQLDEKIIADINKYLEEGFESIAVICKTQDHTEELYSRIKEYIHIKLLKYRDNELEKGVILLPVYMTKGLEFDVVLIYGADSDNFKTNLDRKLLYIACTRALHRLGLYYTGDVSPLLIQ